MTREEPRFARYPWWRRWFGARSERAAAAFLRRKGYRVLAANVQTGAGELDLIALDNNTLVIVEVRSTESDDLQRPAESIDETKQRRITEAAVAFLSRRRLLGESVRFDVLILGWPSSRRKPLIEHFEHAFEATGRYQMFS